MSNKDIYSGMLVSTKTSGDLIVVDVINSRNIKVKFIDTGFTACVTASSVRKKEVKDPTRPTVFGVAYMGAGKYKSRNKGPKTKQYIKWMSMLQRCYDEKFIDRNPHYKGCSVCDDWLNFQNFAKWFDENYIEGFELDKDIMTDGNREYGPTSCMFVSHKKNMQKARAKVHSFVNPGGEHVYIYNLSKFCRDNGLHLCGMSRVSTGERMTHKGWTKGA